jgi:hypothetical protein
MIAGDGGPLTDSGTQLLRTALAAAGFWWLPEVTGRKMVPKPYSDWRQRTEPFDPAHRVDDPGTGHIRPRPG